MPKVIPSFNTGWLERKDGKEVSAITVILRCDYPDKHMLKESLVDLCHEMVKPFVGAWRVMPQIMCDKGLKEEQIYCRFFLGKPEDYEEVLSPK